MNPLAIIALAILSSHNAHEGETIRIDNETVCMRTELGHAVCMTDKPAVHHVSGRFQVRNHHGRRVYVYPHTIVISANDLAALGTDMIPMLSGVL